MHIINAIVGLIQSFAAAPPPSGEGVYEDGVYEAGVYTAVPASPYESGVYEAGVYD